MGMPPNTYCMLLHLSQLANLMPGLGIVAPIVMWAIAKDKSPQVDQHGKIVLNWMISAFIYGIACTILCITIIGLIVGVPGAIALVIVAIVFPIIAAVKANNDGTAWNYPLSIKFFR